MTRESVNKTSGNVQNPIINPIIMHFLPDGRPAVSSLDVARDFGRQHSALLIYIKWLRTQLPEAVAESSFVPEEGGERFLLTRDALSLMPLPLMREEIKQQLRYLQAFSSWEAIISQSRFQDVLEEQARESELARQSSFLQGYDEGRASALPDLLAAEDQARRAACA